MNGFGEGEWEDSKDYHFLRGLENLFDIEFSEEEWRDFKEGFEAARDEKERRRLQFKNWQQEGETRTDGRRITIRNLLPSKDSSQ